MRQILKLGGSVLAAAILMAVPAARTMSAADQPAKTDASADKKVSVPKMSIDPMSKDAGTVAKGEKIEAVFVVKNSGTADLVITDARPSCGCTVAQFDRTIKAGETGKITASVDTKNFTGPITKTVTVVSNDPESPQVALTIRAVVKPYVEVLPQEFVRFSTIKGDVATQDLILASAEPGFHPQVGESSQPYVKADISPATDKEKVTGKAGEQYKLHITLEGSAPVGVLNAPIKIKTGVAKQPELELRVSGIVRDRISVTPMAIQFGNFTPGKDVISRNVMIYNNKPATPVKVTSATTDVKGLTAEVVAVVEGTNYTIVLKPTSGIAKGEFKGTLKVSTSDKERPTLDVPVSGNAL